MPYKTFHNWLFDGNIKTPIPIPKVDPKTNNVIIPDIMKYNSPITHTYVLSMFLMNAKLNKYLDIYLNNIGLRYLDKESLFLFIKKCVIDFKVKRNSIPFSRRGMRKHILFEKLRKKIPVTKDYEMSLLCDIVDKSEDKERIYATLGIDKPKKEKIRKNKAKSDVGVSISLSEFLEKYFVMEEVHSFEMK